MSHSAEDRTNGTPSPARRAFFTSTLVVLFSLFVGLGTWQVERRSWKLALIARVDHRVHAAPVAAPGPAQWPNVDAASDEYRKVRLHGRFLNGKETQVYTATQLGPGYWVMTPLRRSDGTVVMVNRGFVPLDRRRPDTRTAGDLDGQVSVTGLMRMSEPDGTWLRSNRPLDDRWYSRDVEAMAASHGLARVAPYFVDADATPNPGGWPKGGLTRIKFRNSHLVYAITWYALALMTAVGGFIFVRQEKGRRDPAGKH